MWNRFGTSCMSPVLPEPLIGQSSLSGVNSTPRGGRGGRGVRCEVVTRGSGSVRAGAGDPVGGERRELGGVRLGAAGGGAHGVRGRAARHAVGARARAHHERPLLRRRLCRSHTYVPS